MRRRKGSSGRAVRWALLLAALAAVCVLTALLWSECGGLGRSPVYLPHGDVVFLPRG